MVCWKYRLELCEVHTCTQNFGAHLHFALNDPTLKKQLFAKCNGTIGVFLQGVWLRLMKTQAGILEWLTALL